MSEKKSQMDISRELERAVRRGDADAVILLLDQGAVQVLFHC